MAEESQEKSVKPDAGPTGFGRTEWVTVSAVIAVFIFTYVVAAWLPEWVRAIFNVTDAGAEGGGRFGVFGPIGDFFGGILNPILTFFTVFLLLQSLKLQREELADTRAELARTAKASEEMVKLQNEQIQSAIRSADALTAAAKAQRLALIIETKSTELREIKVRISDVDRKLEIFRTNVNLKFREGRDVEYKTLNQSMEKLLDERKSIEKLIKDIGDEEFMKYKLRM